MIIGVEGISHSTAPVEVREQFALTRHKQESILLRLCELAGIRESAILNTCNRLELYVVAEQESSIGQASIMTFLPKEHAHTQLSHYNKYIYNLRNAEAIRHLFRVSASIDSMILGEPQILGQVKQAIQLARQCKSAGTVLNKLFEYAIGFGKRIRAQTDIGKGTVSVPFAAVNLIFEHFQSLDGKTIVLIGTGKMNKLAARRLVENTSAQLYIASRDLARAKSFAKHIPYTKPVEFNFALKCLIDADIVLTSTDAPHCLIYREQMEEIMKQRGFRPLMIIDIAVPRDVDPEVRAINGVTLFNIDDLKNIVDKNIEARRKVAERIEEMTKKETEKFCHWLATHNVKPAIIALRHHIEKQCADEINRLRALLGTELTPEQEEYFRQFTRSIANKIAHQPVKRIKQLASNGMGFHYAEILNELFAVPEREKKHNK
ncbi:glutamyl-tRNA reductase [Candidatus Sumerlaeota bacterium]|nr:glutamyl-tRNA reductase [Candidatus Sumerlaeota bacterium]